MKFSNFLFIFCIIFTLVACGKQEKRNDDFQEETSELEKLGEVEVEDQSVYVYINAPLDYAKYHKQIGLDLDKGKLYTEANIIDSKTVTYKMTKQQLEAMKAEIEENIEDRLDELILSNEIILDINHNEYFSEFNMLVDTSRENYLHNMPVTEFFFMYDKYRYFISGDDQYQLNIYDENHNFLVLFNEPT